MKCNRDYVESISSSTLTLSVVFAHSCLLSAAALFYSRAAAMPSKESIEAENAALKIRIVELTGDERAHSLTRDGEIQEEPEHIDEEVVGTKDGTTLLVQEEPTTQNGSTTDRRVIEPDVPD